MSDMSVIIVAAGSSRRMGFDKLMADLAGQPVVLHSLRAFQASPAVGEILLVTRPELHETLAKLASAAGVDKLRQVLPGGATRYESVWQGLQALGPAAEFVAVHDGARPLTSARAIAGCLERARAVGAASCAAPVTDTLKRAQPPELLLEGGVPRENLWAMQTPQIFRRDLLLQAYAHTMAAGREVTDETSALQELGLPVSIYNNPDWNPKITYPADLELAQAWLQTRSITPPAPRPGS